jgi:hypothetical protein
MYDQTQTADLRNVDTDDNVLAQIVEAMLDVQSELADASVEDWSRRLVASCRRQKQRFGDSRVSMASTC